MVAKYPQFHLTDLSRSVRVVVTGFVILAAVGYLVAILNLHLTYSTVDGKPGVTPQDLKLSFYGNRENTVLAKKISPGGSMAQYLKSELDRGTILTWIQRGANEADFAPVKAIMDRDCVRCHSPSGAASFRKLTNFTEVHEVTQVDMGETPQMWARVAHTHLQALALIYFCLGLIFCCCWVPEKIKFVVVTTPFVSLVTDFGSRALAKYVPDMVYVVMASGALLGLSTMIMTVVPLYQMWLMRAKPSPDAADRGPFPPDEQAA